MYSLVTSEIDLHAEAQMARSITAVVVGFVFIGVLSFGADAAIKNMMPDAFGPTGRVESTPVLLLTIGYVLVFAVAGCYLTARLAPRNPMKHALVLGVLGLIFNVVGTVVMWEAAPAWYHIISLLLVMPAAWVGGQLGEVKARRATAV